jgi:hypothetical protein
MEQAAGLGFTAFFLSLRDPILFFYAMRGVGGDCGKAKKVRSRRFLGRQGDLLLQFWYGWLCAPLEIGEDF